MATAAINCPKNNPQMPSPNPITSASESAIPPVLPIAVTATNVFDFPSNWRRSSSGSASSWKVRVSSEISIILVVLWSAAPNIRPAN